MSTERRRPRQTRWNHPAGTLALGILLGGAAWLGGKPTKGLFLLGVFVVVAIGVAVATARSERFRETFEADERFKVADLQAGRAAAVAMLAVLVGGFMFELARGRTLGPISGLTFIVGAFTYTGAQVFFSRRL